MSTPAREGLSGSRVRRRALFVVGSLTAAAGIVLGGLAAPVPTFELEEVAQAAVPDSGAALPFVTNAQSGVLNPPTVDDVEQMCALLTACDNLPIPRGIVPQDHAGCVKKLSEDLTSPGGIAYSLTLRECGLGANSCADLKKCAARGAEDKACEGRGMKAPVSHCDELGRAITCYQGKIFVVRNCPFGGEQCRVTDKGAQCILGPCSSDAGDAPYCSQSGTRVLQCEKGKLTSLDCAAFGLKCSSIPATDGGAAVGCTTSGAACTAGSKRCDGKVAVTCHGGHEVRVNCAAAGLECDAKPGSPTVGACVVPSSAVNCSPSDAAKCDGNNVKYCANGRQRSYLCSALFATCGKENGNVRCVKKP